MKKTILTLCTLIATITLSGQSPYSLRMTFYGGNLSVSPSEEIWVTTKSGYLLHAESLDSLWHFGSFGNKVDYPYGGKGTFERVTPFNNDTLMISGFIHGDPSETDFVWWTGNKGRTWEKIKFGTSSWADAFYHLPNGKAWMSGSSQLIYYTEDFGRTWQPFDKIEKEGNLRFMTICFDKDETTGLFGSTWNVIYKTTDNCRTWEKLPTPYSQDKYKWKYEGHSNIRPEIDKLRIIGNYYIVSQHQRIFVTRKDSIDWEQLPSVIDFEVTVNGKIYLLHKDDTVELLDSSLTSLWKSTESLPEGISSITTQNETLFFLTRHSVGKINPKTYLVKEAFTDELPIVEPFLKAIFRGQQYGFADRDILEYDKSTSKWKRSFSADFAIGNATVYKGTIIVTNDDLTKHFTLDVEKKQLQPFILPDKLFATDAPIKEFRIELGSDGCFHHESSGRTYVRKGTVFKSDPKKDTTGDKNEMPVSIDVGLVEHLVHALDRLKYHRLSLADLEISAEDILNYQKFIDEESLSTEEKSPYFLSEEVALYTFDENTDFSIYKDIVPLLDKVTDDIMEDVFNPMTEFWSTTTDWCKISIWLGNDTFLEITNSDYKPNYYYSPWVIKYNGLVFKVNSFEVGKIINELTNGCFLSKRYRDKKYPLFQIGNYFFRVENE
ncbi:hypothetical protein [Bacteroides sp. 51]|uniref:VPS10 domain-containing protein n=1 Tax=Bacteroides sp. 51 TaxID=2302938 RepID=UPI0013D04031|nr:hypothetical protein [Bacteroides sp. 51]